MSKIPCELVQDLLPNYIENLTGEKSTELIKAHLETCEDCRKVYRSMTGEEEAAGLDESSKKVVPERKEIDFLKKNRRRNRRIVIACILGGLLLTAGLLYAWFFLIGQKSESSFIYCDVEVEGQHISVSGWVADSISVIRKIRFKEKDGVVTMTPVTVWASAFHRGSFSAEYDAKEKIREVRMNHRVLWRSADTISISSRLSEEILKTYEAWDEKSEMEKMLSSTLPGSLMKAFGTWKDAEAYLGCSVQNLFEDAEGFEIMNYAGTNVVLPESSQLEHALISFAGSREGEILYLGMTAGYQTEGVRVVYQAEPFGRREESGLVYDEKAGLHASNEIPGGVQVSANQSASFEEKGVYTVSSRYSTDIFIAEDILYTMDGIDYSVRLTSLNGEEALDRAEAAVKQRIEEALSSGQ